MKFISNAKYGEPVESGTIFRTRISGTDIVIHRIFQIEGWYLSCERLQIKDEKLKSETLTSAIKEVKNVLKNKIDYLNNVVDSYDPNGFEISRY